ncbi:polyketide synthase, partial [Sesbania bispinosa]
REQRESETEQRKREVDIVRRRFTLPLCLRRFAYISSLAVRWGKASRHAGSRRQRQNATRVECFTAANSRASSPARATWWDNGDVHPWLDGAGWVAVRGQDSVGLDVAR